MSAIVAVRFDDEISLYTDGAACTPDGALSHVTSKIRIFPQWSAALAYRGTEQLPALLGMWWPRHARSFDEASTLLPLCASKALEILDLEQFPSRCFELVFAGLSERTDKFEVYDLKGGDQPPDAHACDQPLSLRQIHGCTSSWPIPDSEPLQAIWPHDAELSSSDIGVLFMTAIRSRKYPHQIGGALYHAVGGFIQETRLARDGCSSRIMLRWDDPLGEPIDPTRRGQASA